MQLYRPRHKTARKALQALFPQFVPLSRRRYQTDTSSYNTVCDTLERITAPQHLHHIPDTTTTPGRRTGQHSRPIIIRYIRVQRHAPVMDPCKTVQHTSPAWSALAVCGSLASAAPGAPAEGSASPPVQGQPGGLQSGTGQRSGRTGSACPPPPGGAVQRQGCGGRRGTIDGSRRSSFGLSPDS